MSVIIPIVFAALSVGGCADVAMMYPTSDPIPTPGATRTMLDVPDRPNKPVDVVELRDDIPPGDEPEVYLLVFAGMGGRAERAAFDATAETHDRPAEIWAVNYPGYGRSKGYSKLSAIPSVALAAYDAIKAKAGDKPVVIVGISLGSTAALHVAANRPVSGLILSNPPPLRELLTGHYGWWNLWIVASIFAAQVPDELDSLRNAPRVTCPAVIVTADRDSTVPPIYQQRVIDAYAGPKVHVILKDADHTDDIVGESAERRGQAVQWLWATLSGNEPSRQTDSGVVGE